jgi:hypothetical protein
MLTGRSQVFLFEVLRGWQKGTWPEDDNLLASELVHARRLKAVLPGRQFGSCSSPISCRIGF